MGCLFCSLIASPDTQFVYADEQVVAFNDIHPKAPLHVLVVPRRHIASVTTLTEADESVAGRLLLAARTIANERGVADSGYRLILNTGVQAGQSVNHLHVHLLGGGKLARVTA